jgi:2-polyprenyl-6-methoxyphenol hydroxylase-like FAD-dependent oxidoreductase
LKSTVTPTKESTLKTAVLVVGGGAAGLSAALELGWRGQQVLLVDEGTGDITHPRTGAISVRTMEFCRRWGIVGEVRRCGFPADYPLDNVFCTSLSGYELARAEFPSMRAALPPAQSPEGRQRCPQMWFDPILARAAARHPSVTIRYRTHLDELRVQPDGGVLGECHDTDTGERIHVAATYAVACDGAAGGIREQFAIGMSGQPLLNYSINVLFRAPDLLAKVGQGGAARFIFISPTGTLGNITVVNGADIWRFTFLAGKERIDLDAVDLPALLRRVIGRDDVDFEILSIAPWRRSQLVADRYRAGPVLFAGDAVHTMSPTGGFGANTAIGDAVDLGWKLDAVLRGWGGLHLLDSYELERRPVALRNSAASTRNFRGWSAAADTSRILDATPDAERDRRAIGETLLESTRPEWESLGVILGYRYENSPLCVDDGSPEPPDDYSVYVPTNRAGSRAPHAWVDAATSTLDLFGRGYVLLDTGPDDGAAARLLSAAGARGLPLRRAFLPPHAADNYQGRFSLVRPDGHVAWRGDHLAADSDELLDIVSGHSSQ